MADTGTAKDKFGWLTQKAGPLPLWVWLAIGAGIIYYIRTKQSGGSLGSLFGGSSASSVPNQQTDPAGNIGTIDPATGYVYGTPEDNAALAANNATGAGTTPSGGATVAGQYADNNAWQNAAINYLVGLGIDPTTANEAIGLYLSSQSLTTQQQADVNEAIQALGAPPTAPGPVGNTPAPVVGGTGGGTTGTGTGTTGTTGTSTSGGEPPDPVPGQTYTTPNVLGMQVPQAIQAINAAGMFTEVQSGIINSLGTGIVTYQDPAPGTPVTLSPRSQLPKQSLTVEILTDQGGGGRAAAPISGRTAWIAAAPSQAANYITPEAYNSLSGHL